MTLTVTRLPQAFEELRDLARNDAQAAAAEVRRRTRCAAPVAREFVALLPHELELVRKFPDQVALLLGEPQPGLLRRFAPRRSELLRLVRRGRKLEALALVRSEGDISLFEAREFCDALRLYGSDWEQIEEDYAFPGRNFWQQRPQPQAAPVPDSALLIAPEVFDPQLLLQWLGAGQHRAAVLWVRRVTGASREECQALVDRLEELVFENHADPWGPVIEENSSMVAALAQLPDPLWLVRLRDQRQALVHLLASNRNLAAVELVCNHMRCSSVQARRFLRLLREGASWDSTLELFDRGFRWPERVREVQRPAQALHPFTLPVAPTPAPTAAPATGPAVLRALPGPGEADSEHTEFFGPCPLEDGTASAVHGLGALPWQQTGADSAQASGEARKVPWDSARDAAHTASTTGATPWDSARDAAHTASTPGATPWDSARDAAHTASTPGTTPWTSERASANDAANVSAAVHELDKLPWQQAGSSAYTSSPLPPPPLDLNDADALFSKLVDLGDALQRKNEEQARQLLAELEAAGLSSRWVADKYPPLRMMLPPDPWSQNLEELGPAIETLQGVLDGSLDPQKLARDLAEKTLRAANLDKIVHALETAWKTRKRADLELAVGLVREHPDLEQEINARVPWLRDLLDMDQDGTADILEVTAHPGQFFLELLQRNHPEVLQRLGEAKIKKLQEALPELLDAMKQRNMREVMRTMTRLRLGPSDVKALLGVIKGLLKR